MVSGITLKGVVRVNDTLLLGPDPVGHFISTSIRSIHRKRMLVKEVRGGQTASFALKKVRYILIPFSFRSMYHSASPVQTLLNLTVCTVDRTYSEVGLISKIISFLFR